MWYDQFQTIAVNLDDTLVPYQFHTFAQYLRGRYTLELCNTKWLSSVIDPRLLFRDYTRMEICPDRVINWHRGHVFEPNVDSSLGSVWRWFNLVHCKNVRTKLQKDWEYFLLTRLTQECRFTYAGSVFTSALVPIFSTLVHNESINTRQSLSRIRHILSHVLSVYFHHTSCDMGTYFTAHDSLRFVRTDIEYDKVKEWFASVCSVGKRVLLIMAATKEYAQRLMTLVYGEDWKATMFTPCIFNTRKPYYFDPTAGVQRSYQNVEPLV